MFCVHNGVLKLVRTALAGPNGLAFSADEKYLYVTNWDTARKVVMRYSVAADGTLSKAGVFFDMTEVPGNEALETISSRRR